MQHAFAAGHRRVAIVGTDVPDLTAHIVLQALRALDGHQAVFGPAADGGYYLLALSSLPQALFEDIEWSTATVLAASVANAQRVGLSVAPLGTLPKLLDIDTLADLQRWLALQQQQHGHQQQPEEQQQRQQEAGLREPKHSMLQQLAQQIVQQTSQSLN
ncbi:glycosyl transferase [Chlorella sorokiniana]|uniref:Glycosyl transferase n=1 Tax=Chlorella sorokiniana TaxID=3076 RepID=A0A2P6TI91_CHLSO|nr:glycosyl transferase [Chlorella sorokiniana]|eukprot:PRW33997.1 glycosyl transferase [Chlorella sorokiniana]